MLKYSDRITKLTDGQKIRILSGVGEISGKDMKNLGIPTIKIGNMKAYERNVYPHTTSISHAWNVGLWKSVASVKVEKMMADGVQFAVAPGSKIKLSPYRKETSEDPYLSSALSGAYLSAATEADMTVGAAGYYVTECEASWMDAEPNNRILNEYITRPYTRAAKVAPGSGVVTDFRFPNEAYEDSCAYIQRMLLGQTEFLVCENANDDNTVNLVAAGVLCLHGSANALSSALAKYRKMKKQIEEGRDVTIIQLEDAVKKGEAISDETVDEAVDRALDFLFSCKREGKAVTLSEEEQAALALQATLESTVLLKNQNALLPLLSQMSVTVVDAFLDGEGESTLAQDLEKALSAHGTESVQSTRFAAEDSMQDNLNRILPLCREADVTVLLLGSGYEAERQIHKTEKLTLPPKQLCLAERVAKKANRVVTVILSEHGTDVDFTRPFEGLLYAPLPVTSTAEALARILCGDYNPTGRLAYTLYAGTETSLHKGRMYLRDNGLKSGPFVGYRYYDTADLRVGYPFGHGLSYTEFMYYDLDVAQDSVSFTVQNCTRLAGTEVAQVYVGMPSSALLRPKKELCGFAKVDLGPFERKRITVKIEMPTVFDGNGLVLEQGTYTVFVGASVSDVRLQKCFEAGDTVLPQDGERLSDYLQSHSNILNDNYTLEANYSVMKKGITNIVAGVVSLALAISLAVFNITTQLGSLALGIISGILALGSILFFIIEMVDRSRLHAEERKKIKAANDAYFENAEQIPILSTDKMFADAFDADDDEEDDIPQHVIATDDDVDYSEFIDTKLLMRDAVAEFNRFAAERGYKMDRGVTENLMASLTVSKLLVLGGLSAEEFNSFVLLISEYFGCIPCLDVPGKVEVGKNIFFERDAEGYGAKKNIFRAIENAAADHSKISISAVDEVTAENVTEWLSPLMRYVRSPKRKNVIIMKDQYGEKLGFTIGTNLFTLVRLSEYDAVDMLPLETVKCAPVVNVSFTKCPVAEDQSVSHGFSAYQIDYMRTQASEKYEVLEETWKKIDKIEKYADQYSGYKIGNKLWLALEKHMEMLLASGLEADEVTDIALATKILPSMSVALKNKLGEEDKTILQSVEFIFGADHVECAKVYIDSLTVKEREEEPKPVVEEAPAEEFPIEEELVEEAPIEEAPVEEAPVEEVPVEEVPVEEVPVEEAPVEEALVEEEPVDEAFAEEVVENKTPIDETPVEEAPVEEAFAEEVVENEK